MKRADHLDLLANTIAAEILRNLSPRQREALLWLPADRSRRADERHNVSLWALMTRPVVPGVEARLVEYAYVAQGSPRHEWWLTRFGQKVRTRYAPIASGSVP